MSLYIHDEKLAWRLCLAIGHDPPTRRRFTADELKALTVLGSTGDVEPYYGTDPGPDPSPWSFVIRDLNGLEHCPNLENLPLAGNHVQTLDPISHCVKLEFLDLSENRISDLRPLRGLTRLDWLDLSDNPIVDLEPIAGLPLTTLKLGSNYQLDDLSPLAGMATLEEFYFDYMEVLDCRLLCDLPALREVYLRGARAWHEAAPEALARLREVCVRIETSSELDAEIDRIVAGRAKEAVAVKLAAAGLDDLADLWKLHGPTYRRDDASMLHILVDRIRQDAGGFEDFRCADLVRSMVAVGVDTARMWDTRETAIWGMVETETKLCDTFDALMDICFPSRRTATSTTDDGEG